MKMPHSFVGLIYTPSTRVVCVLPVFVERALESGAFS
jgi:hypothetical protein